MLAAIRNPWTHIISHPGDGAAELDFKPLVMAAAESHTLLEINNTSFRPARGLVKAHDNNLAILRLCREQGVPVILGRISSGMGLAPTAFAVADYGFLYPLLEETNFPDELIMNYDTERFLNYLNIPADN